jgi:hypothetical protein
MDIAENGISAGADLIELKVIENKSSNLLEISIRDNGRGMPEELINRALDPFYTTRTTRRIGLGLSLFRAASERCEGEFRIDSREGKGTEVFASFRLNHIDLAPLGDISRALIALIVGNPAVDFVYTHQVEANEFELDTRSIKAELEDVSIGHPQVIKYLGESIRRSLAELKAGLFAGA